MTSTEDQQKFVVPLNRDTEHIFYNQRIIIDAPVLSEPRTWKVSKINRLASRGLCMCTLAQDSFDQHSDYIEIDDNGNVLGMWANYYSSAIEPQPLESDVIINNKIVINYSGLKPEIKIGGSYKTFTAKYYDENDNELPISGGIWEYLIDDIPIDPDLITSIDDGFGKNKVKFNGDLSYLGKIITIKFTSSDGVTNAIEVEIKRL